MDVVRRFSLLATSGLLGVAVLLGWVDERPAMSASAATQLVRATAYFDSTIVLARGSRPRGAAGDRLAIALGYLERLRLGLGDPFRLADEALDDPRLDAHMGARVAWALLGRLRRGDAYLIDPVVLDGSGPWSADGHGATGAAHLALIEHTIASASDPRAGELAVRLAYQIEVGKGVIAGSSVSTASEVAALIRDREMAVSDLDQLLADASDQHEDVMAALETRRATRAFRVEDPSLAPLDAHLQVEAMNAVPALVRALDTLDRVDAASTPRAPAPVIGSYFAADLRALGALRPPQSPVVVTLGAHVTGALRATNEETLASEYAPLAASDDSSRRASALSVLSASVALRALAQRVPWFTGDPAPTVSDLAAEFGIRSVVFGRDVPDAWRPLYLRELRDALRDMQLALPALDFDDLRVRFGADPLPDSALAMHDPRTRTLDLSILTSGGTLAHELAHDLDWQTAKRLFAVSGGYSTDRAMREQRGGEALAQSVRGLAEARLLRPVAGVTSPPTADRPAELFARGVDWFVASSLAAQGRSNGFLTAIEDATLSGYAAGAPSAVGTAPVASIVNALEQMTYVPDSTRAAFASLWSDPSVVDPVVVVRRVLQAPVWYRGVWGGAGAGMSASRVAAALVAATPFSPCPADGSPVAEARDHLLEFAIDARARGIVLRRARYHPASIHAAWSNAMLGIAPWAPDGANRLIAGLKASMTEDVTNNLADQGLVPVVPSIFRSSSASCAAISR